MMQEIPQDDRPPTIRLDLVPQTSACSDVSCSNKLLSNNKIINNNSLAPSSKCTKNIPKNVRLSSRNMQIGNLVRTKLYSSFPNLPNNVIRKDPLNSKWYQDVDENINVRTGKKMFLGSKLSMLLWRVTVMQILFRKF